MLSELFRIPDIIRKRLTCGIPAYDFCLIEADHINVEDYETGLREFFQAMQCRKDKKKLIELCHSEKFHNLDPETAKMIAVCIDRKRLMLVTEKPQAELLLMSKVEKEGVLLCQAFDELMEDKRLEGMQESEDSWAGCVTVCGRLGREL